MLYLRQSHTLWRYMSARIMKSSKQKLLFLCTLCVLHVVYGEIILRVDPLALLSATLRTYQKVACDTDQVLIACPRGTSISIEFAQYNKFIAKDGVSIDELCPAEGDMTPIRSKAKHLLRGSTFGYPTQQVAATQFATADYALTQNKGDLTKSNSSANATSAEMGKTDTEHNTPENCMWPNALQYSLLQAVVEACQKRRHCKFNGTPQYYDADSSGVGENSYDSNYHSSSTANTNAVDMDPCPKRRKIVEVAYKCRPYEFRSKVACHNDAAQLECNPYSRIAVYSATFGRTEYESIQCPQPQGVREETCLASRATETVMQICHGRRRCNIAANANTFGSPCQPNSRMYLKVVYTCVPKQVLKDRYESEVEVDEAEDFDGNINELYDDDLIYKESQAIPKLYSNATVNVDRINFSTSVTTITLEANDSTIFHRDISDVNPVMTHSGDLTLEDDQERLYIYLLVSASLGVIVCIIIVGLRVLVQKRQDSSHDTQAPMSVKTTGGGISCAETTIPNGFNDTISEIDTDIDLTTPVAVSSVSNNENYITYCPSASLYGPSVMSNMTSTVVLHGSAIGCPTTGLVANRTQCGLRQSPDVIGISTSTHFTTNTSNAERQTNEDAILAPAIVISGANTYVNSACGINTKDAIVPTLTHYTTVPSFRPDYIISSDKGIPRPPNTTNLQKPIQNIFTNQQLQPQHQQITGLSNTNPMSSTSTVCINPTASLSVLQQQPSYDGTAPRTLSTGVPVDSQFYYG
ncbi:uncharacterized protein LOC119684154 [Teleopsis dalmanni]|uniref:uncharacterized protein LOC119684154 n=1 Tax=Teleopsis dalmanni TaxID=139649 RepID=UPI0018CEF045|nr:uncharacterized protein LOC119684154 [Teleopsis dalmanni]